MDFSMSMMVTKEKWLQMYYVRQKNSSGASIRRYWISHCLQEKMRTINYHFTLGMWIRNNWIYPLKDYERESFMKMFEDEDRSPYGSHFIHPDEVSSTIIEMYVKYLVNKD